MFFFLNLPLCICPVWNRAELGTFPLDRKKTEKQLWCELWGGWYDDKSTEWVVDHERSQDNQVCGDKTANVSHYICALARWIVRNPEMWGWSCLSAQEKPPPGLSRFGLQDTRSCLNNWLLTDFRVSSLQDWCPQGWDLPTHTHSHTHLSLFCVSSLPHSSNKTSVKLC